MPSGKRICRSHEPRISLRATVSSPTCCRSSPTPYGRWFSLSNAMLAYALLAVLAATEHTHRPAPAGLIALTCNEIHRLFNRLILEPARRLPNPLAWSYWRRRHQHRARTSDNQRRPET